MRRIWLSSLLVPMLFAVPAKAQTEMDPPRDYAITNVRIVVAPGQVLEQGTVLVRGGRIAAAGAAVSVPAGVIELDMTGMTVYPGLIDAANSVGLPRIAAQGGGRGAATLATPTNEPPPELNPARAAADVFSATDSDLDAFRAAGFTTVGLAFDGGIFPGRVSAVNLTGGPTASMVLRSPVAQQVLAGRRRGGYPSTLMGAVAYIKQSFWDAQWDRQATQAFERNPASTERPEYDAEHRALQPAATGAMPVWFSAAAERDLRRFIGIAAEIDVSDYVLVGVQEGYRTVDAIVAAGKPVIVSLDYPAFDRVTGRAYELHVAPVSGTDEAKAEADSTIARLLRGNAAALAEAGVTLALSGLGLSSPAQFRERILGTVEAGLSAEAALRALTITPATLLGLDAVVGTVEQGKLANLVVADGDLFAEDTKIKHVFVEGLKFDIPEPTARSEGRGGRGGGPGDAAATGEWFGELEGPNGMMNFTLTIRAEGEELVAQLVTDMGPVDLRGTRSGENITLNGTAAPPDMNPIEITITAAVEGTELRGSLDAAGMAVVPFTARRRGPGSARGQANAFGQQREGGRS